MYFYHNWKKLRVYTILFCQCLIGHNEDWIPSMAGYDLILCASISEFTTTDGRTYPSESFVVHTWPGILMGMNSGFNKHGLVFSIDHLFPDNVNSTKTGIPC